MVAQIRLILQIQFHLLVDKELRQIHDGVLGDIAPTILELMGN
jgi:bisphosphoglycerate-independent phosphoglycerate mutase (AlkP superfamily)